MTAKTLPLIALALLAACGGERRADRTGDAGDVPEGQRYGGTAVIALGADITDINPITSSDHNSNQVQLYVLFTPVVHYTADFEPVPGLARSWELTPDSTELVFHLRDDVLWHDGVKTTAYDLKFAYDLARDPATGFPNSAWWTHYGEAAAPDSFTFRVRLRPHAEYMDPWRTFFAMPRHVMGDVSPAELRGHPFTSSRPLGNGPFRFVSRAPGQNWVFEANPTYPEELGGRPYLDRLVIRVIPEATTRLAELLNGVVDYYVGAQADHAARIEQAPNARLEKFRDRAYVLVGWNQRRSFFADRRVRQALTLAINKQGIIDGILHGHGEIAHSSIPNIYWQADAEAGREFVHDTARARALLKEAGLEDRDGDGIVEDASGRPFRFTIKTNTGNQLRLDIAQVVQSNLRAVGIDAQVQVVEFNTLIQQLNDVRRRDFDAVVMGWVAELKIDDRNLFHCDHRDQPYQWVGYCNPRTSALIDTTSLIVDREAARPYWSEYQRLIAEDQPYTFLYFQHRLEGVSERLRNVEVDARGDLVGVARWYIPPARRGRGGAGEAAGADTGATAARDTGA
jgi:peptide/nickel transport system substrate-binding protein